MIEQDPHSSAGAIAKAFTGFEPKFERGRYPRPGIPAVYDLNYNNEPPVESSFNDDQLPHVLKVMTQLNGLALGRIASEDQQEGQNFCSRVVARYGRTGKTRDESWPFTDAVIQAIMSVARDHKRTFPELRPAMVAMLRQAGIAGTLVAVEGISPALDEIILYQLTTDQLAAS